MAASNKIKKVMRGIRQKDISPARKSALFALRIAPEDKKRLERTAKALKMSLSEFLIQAGLFAADRLDTEGKK